jgi:hypothetical protein
VRFGTVAKRPRAAILAVRRTGAWSLLLFADRRTTTKKRRVLLLDQTFDADGNRTSLAAEINGTADLADTFSYNDLDDLTYDGDDRLSGISACHWTGQITMDMVGYKRT